MPFSIPSPILWLLAGVCLWAAISRLRIRQRNREKRLADSFSSAVRGKRI
jgi:hypothetical protein